MALSQPRIIFGVHSFTAYNRTNGLPYGTSLVLGNSSFSLAGELVTLVGGSNRYPWAIEDGNITAELSLTFKQYEDWMLEVFLGKAPTVGSGDALGAVSNFENVSGTSVSEATTGIAGVAPLSGSEDNLKFGKYVIKVETATTIKIFAYTNIDFARGTSGDFQNDQLEITSSDLTVPDTGGTVSLANFGLEITGGSGTVAMTPGDTARFEVLPKNEGGIDVVFGGTNDVYPEFGALMLAQQRGSQEMVELDVFRAKAIGLPIGMQEKAFSEAEVTAQAYYDAEKGGVFKKRYVKPIV
jgi:hypothetical protein